MTDRPTFHPSDLLSPSTLTRLVHDQGMTPEAAFDLMAEEAGTPEFQAVIAQFQLTVTGREILAQQRRYFDREGMPCPFDVYLDLQPVY